MKHCLYTVFILISFMGFLQAGIVCIWDAETGKQLKKIITEALLHTGSPYSGCGKFVGFRSNHLEGKIAKIWDLEL